MALVGGSSGRPTRQRTGRINGCDPILSDPRNFCHVESVDELMAVRKRGSLSSVASGNLVAEDRA